MTIGNDLERTPINVADSPLTGQVPREDSIAFTNEHFPCLVHKGPKAESLKDCPSQFEHHHRIARNALRYLTYGISIGESQLISFEVLKFIFWRRDPDLLKAMRGELQTIFNNSFNYLSENKLDDIAKERMETLLSHLLCILPYLDPEEGSQFYIPQKINDQWEFEPFKFKKIDISPQKKKSWKKTSFFSYITNIRQVMADFLANIIDDRDRLYAYCLEHDNATSNKSASPILSLMGSHYFSGQGAFLNWIYNFMPRTSVGEGHDLSKVEEWLTKHQDVRVAGHSKGGTLAMILTAKYPEYISKATCLNPALLNQNTINRLKESLEKLAKHMQRNVDKLQVNIYVQYNDPVFWLGHLVLPGAKIYSVGDQGLRCTKLESHGLYICGRESVALNLKDIEVLDDSPNKRSFYADNKEILDWVIFPILYVGFVGKVALRKIGDLLPKSIQQNKFVAGLKTAAEIVATAVYATVATAILMPAVLVSCTYTLGKLVVTNIYKRFFGYEKKTEPSPDKPSRSGGSTTDISAVVGKPNTNKNSAANASHRSMTNHDNQSSKRSTTRASLPANTPIDEPIENKEIEVLYVNHKP